MTRSKLSTVGRACVATVLLVTATCVYSTPLFEDHFNGSMSPEWVSVKPAQWVEDGWLRSQSDGSLAGRNADLVAHDGDTAWRDYSLSVVVDPTTYWGPWEAAEVYFRTNGTLTTPTDYNGIWGDWYILWIDGPYQNNGLTLGRQRVEGSQYVQLAQVLGATPHGPMNVQIDLLGPRITIQVNGQPMIDYVDPDPLLYGGVGLESIWESHDRFDDVVVTPEPSTSAGLLCGLSCIFGIARRRRRAS